MAKKELEELIYYFDSWESATVDSRKVSEKCRDYYDGKQWTTDEIQKIESRGQAAIVFNLIASRIDYLSGYERRGRTTAKAYPRTPGEEEGANAITDAIRYVVDKTKWNMTRSLIWGDMLVEGTGGCEVIAKPSRSGDVEICINYVPWDRIWYDPRSRFLDFRDAKYMGIDMWMDLEDAEEMFPGNEDILEQTLSDFSGQDTTGSTSDDRPKFGVWVDSAYRRPRVKIAQCAYRVGPESEATWYTATFCRGGYLIEPRESPYVDPDGQTINPYIFQSAKIDRDNNRYSPALAYLDPQDEVNHRRSKALHLLSMRQTLSERGAIEDLRRAKMEMAKPDGHVVVEPGMRFEVLPTNDMFSGQFELLQEAKAQIDAVGANAALTGRDVHAQSGRALQARQQGGIIELETVFDGLRSMQLHVFESIYSRIRQFWTAEKWIRVTDNQENLKFVGLNKPITLYEKLQKEGQQLPPFESLPPELQRLASQQIIENKIEELDVDIILDDVPDVVSLQQEQFEQLAQMASAGVQIPPDVIIEASSLRNKQEIIDRMRGSYAKTPQEKQAAAQAQQQQQAIQQQAVQLELAQKSADVEKTKSETVKNLAAADKNHVDSADTMAGLISDPNLPPDFTGLQ